MNKNKCDYDKKANLAILSEEIKIIKPDDPFYPKTEIEQILNSDNKNLILLNGKYGCGKSTIINSIQTSKRDRSKKYRIDRIITSSMLEMICDLNFNFVNNTNFTCIRHLRFICKSKNI